MTMIVPVGMGGTGAETGTGAATQLGVVSTTGNQTIAGVKTFAEAPVVPGFNGGQLAGMRNKIINGKMEIAQRGSTFAAVGNGYTLDRWNIGYVTSAVVTASQQLDTPSDEFLNSFRVAVTTADTSIASADVFVVRQLVEGYAARDLIGRPFTLSFWVRSSKTGVHCVAFRNSVPDRSFIAEYTINAANTWEQKSITVSSGLITAGTWNWTNGLGLSVNWALASGSNNNTTAGAWQTGNFFATANQVNCLDTIGNIFAITGVQLEPGSVATPFEHRPIGAELALCQRYYEAGTVFAVSYASSGTFAQRVQYPYKVNKRASPTSTVTVASGSLTSPSIVVSGSTLNVNIGYSATAAGLDGAFNLTSDAEL